MTEILTESFCERCGTRYTFESTAPRKSRLGRVRTLSKGVRNFVLSDDSSFSEALAEARSEEELAATSHQLDAFHQTFNFCLTCRQYTCGDCWNIAEGRCLTCAPLPGQEEAVSPLGLGALLPEAFEAAPNGNGHAPEDIGIEAWPEMDLPADRLARVLDLAPEATAAEAEAEAVDAAPFEPEARLAEAFDTAPETMLIGVAPGQSLDDAIAEYEARIAAEEAVLAAEEAQAVEAVEAAQAAEEAVLEAEAAQAAFEAAQAAEEAVLEAEAAQAAFEAETAQAAQAAFEAEAAQAAQAAFEAEAAQAAQAAFEAETAAVAAAPESRPEPVAPPPAPVDLVEQPTWPVPPQPVAPMQPPAAPGPTPSPWLTVAPDDNSAPQWPTAPQWPAATPRRDAPAGIAGRPFLPQADALWAASNQEVLGAAPAPLAGAAAAPQAQPCVSCGLSLSANARFCRRCGTRQG